MGFGCLLMIVILQVEISGLTLNIPACGVIGSELQLRCTLDGDSWNSASTRIWSGLSGPSGPSSPPSSTMLINGGVAMSAGNDYEEVIDSSSSVQYFSLNIFSLSWSNVDEQYECTYKFSSSSDTLKNNMIEEWETPTVTDSSNGIIVSYSAVRPVPRVSAKLGKENVTFDVSESKAALNSDGRTYAVSFTYSKSIPAGQELSVCFSTPCSYSYCYNKTGETLSSC